MAMAAWSVGYNAEIRSMAVNGTDMYITVNTRVVKADLATGLISDSNWATGFNSLGFIVAHSNILYIADTGTGTGTGTGEINSIYTINSNGTVAPFFNSNLVGSNITLTAPFGLVIHNNYLYATGYSNIVKINLISPTTDYNMNWVTDGLINGVRGMCIANGNMYVTALESTSGDYLLALIDISTAVASQIQIFAESPSTVTTDGAALYVSTYSSIQKVSFTGNIINSNWGFIESNNSLTSIVVNGEYVYGGNTFDQSIYRFSLAGAGPVICFKDGTLILADKGYVPIEELRKGDLVKTLLDGYKPIYLIGKKEIYHPASNTRSKDQLYIGTQAEIPWLKQDLIVTGSHCILVDDFKAGEKEETIQVLGKVYATDKKYRLPACVDKRFAVYKPEGNYTVYHLALEHDNRVMNYGIYANGLLVETCSKRCMDEYGKLEVIA